MSTWSEFPLKARWIASTILQTLSMLLTASLVNRPCSSTLCYVLKPPIWSHCVPIAANLALENAAQKTINSLPNLVIKCAPHHTETVRRITPKCRLSSRHSGLPPTPQPIQHVESTGIKPVAEGIIHQVGGHSQQTNVRRMLNPITLQSAEVIAIAQLFKEALEDLPVTVSTS